MNATNEPRSGDLKADREAEGTITDHLADPGWRFLDLTERLPVRPACFAPLIGVGDLVLLTGAPAAGKTRALVSLLAGLVVPELAEHVLGGAFVAERDPKTTSQKVVIVDGETGDYDWRRDLHDYIAAAVSDAACWNDHFIHVEPHFLSLRTIDEREAKIREYLKEWHALGARVLAVDSTLSVLQPGAINDAAWVSTKLVLLRQICRELGLTSIVLCHPARAKAGEGKPELPLGSMGQEAIADAVFHISRLDASDRDGIRVKLIKRRRARWIREGTSVKAYFTSDGHYECPDDPRRVWPLLPDESSSNPLLTSRQRVALQSLKAGGHDGVTTKTVAAAMEIAEASALDHLNALEAKDLARRKGAARNTRWFAVADEEDSP